MIKRHDEPKTIKQFSNATDKWNLILENIIQIDQSKITQPFKTIQNESNLLSFPQLEIPVAVCKFHCPIVFIHIETI